MRHSRGLVWSNKWPAILVACMSDPRPSVASCIRGRTTAASNVPERSRLDMVGDGGFLGPLERGVYEITSESVVLDVSSASELADLGVLNVGVSDKLALIVAVNRSGEVLRAGLWINESILTPIPVTTAKGIVMSSSLPVYTPEFSKIGWEVASGAESRGQDTSDGAGPHLPTQDVDAIQAKLVQVEGEIARLSPEKSKPKASKKKSKASEVVGGLPQAQAFAEARKPSSKLLGTLESVGLEAHAVGLG